jgi:hypothetical protein
MPAGITKFIRMALEAAAMAELAGLLTTYPATRGPI